ncbi:MAG: Mg chelatase, subunit ChlI [Parcubacteria group bacterium GW2011_GWF1_45_5]|nr:MAG: Mg chelatase, subunit ChlI [Parcubacteria group bacterium GW2011_GWF1_45_5]
MSSKVSSAAIVGLSCLPIEVEVDMAPGLHMFSIVGLPDAAVNEAKERVSAAVKNSGASPPHHSNLLRRTSGKKDLHMICPLPSLFYWLPIKFECRMLIQSYL